MATITNGLYDVDRSKVIDPENEDPEFFEAFMRTINDALLPHADDQRVAEVMGNNYVGMELAMACGGEGKVLHATVKRRLIDVEGNLVGRANSNPLLDSRKYLVENADGSNEELTANIIAENILSQIDEGRRQMMLSEITDHRASSDAIPQSKGTYENAYGVKRRKVTTRG